MKLRYYCKHIWIASAIARIAWNKKKRLIFIMVPHVIRKMRGKCKWEKKNMVMDKSKKNKTNIYPYVYIQTPKDTQT